MAKRNKTERIIKSKERVKKFAEVFTPMWMVRKMCDYLEMENGEMAFAIESTFIEPSFGTGNFIEEILRRKFDRCATPEDVRTAVGSVYGVEIQQDNVDECKQRILKFTAERFPGVDISDILDRNLACGDFLHPHGIWFLEDKAEAIEQIAAKKKKKKPSRLYQEMGEQDG